MSEKMGGGETITMKYKNKGESGMESSRETTTSGENWVREN